MTDSGPEVPIGSVSRNIKSGWAHGINTIVVYRIAPPFDIFSMVLDGKENDDTAKGNTSIHASRENIVVLLPPGGLPLSDQVHEDEREDHAWSVVAQVVRSILKETENNDNRVHVLANDGLSAPLSERPAWESEQEANQETPLQNRVKMAENLLGSNDTPQDRCRVESSGVRTGEFLTLATGTVVLNGVDGKVKNTHRDETVDDTGDHLDAEQGSWWDSQVVRLFLVGDIVFSL